MERNPPTSTLEWIQAKYGIAVLVAGLYAMAMDRANAERYFWGPIAGGLAIALLSLLSKRLVRYHYTPLQINNGIFILMFLWCGYWFAVHRLRLPASGGPSLGLAFCEAAVCGLSYLAMFFTSCTCQDEMEELEKEMSRCQTSKP